LFDKHQDAPDKPDCGRARIVRDLIFCSYDVLSWAAACQNYIRCWDLHWTWGQNSWFWQNFWPFSLSVAIIL